MSFMIVSLGVKPGRISWIALIGFRGLMLQALSEKHNSFLRPLKKKGFKEERVTTIGWYDIGKSHDPGIQQEPRSFVYVVSQPYAGQDQCDDGRPPTHLCKSA